MKIIGLCGGSGSGKGTVAKFFALYDVSSIDTDVVYHSIISSRTACVDELAAYFGDEVVLESGALDRSRLREIVFNDSALHTALGSITHKHIRTETLRLLDIYKEAAVPAVIIDAPLLFESKFNELCDVTVAVVATVKTRIERIVERDGITREQAEKRINAQISDSELEALCDFVIVNNGDLTDLKLRVDEIAQKIL